MNADHIHFPGYLPEKDELGKEKWPRGDEQVWKDGHRELDTSKRLAIAGVRYADIDDSSFFLHQAVRSITRSFVNHVQTSLARQVYSLDDLAAYQATALSTRDNLLVSVASCSNIISCLIGPIR